MGPFKPFDELPIGETSVWFRFVPSRALSRPYTPLYYLEKAAEWSEQRLGKLTSIDGINYLWFCTKVPPIIGFRNEVDAIAFKLRWC